MAETTLAAISDALKEIDTKKEKLKKAFDDLQSQSTFLSSFSLTWSDLEAHFTSIQNSLTHKFNVLESLESHSKDPSCSPNPQTHMPNDPSCSANPQTQIPKDPSSSSDHPAIQNPVTQVVNNGVSESSVLPRPELTAFCENMDGIGLRKYVNGASKDRTAIRAELPGAIRRAPDPAAMVLDAMEGFYRENEKNKGDKDLQLGGVRRSCVLLLEVLMGISPNVGAEVRVRARKLAVEWKGKVSRDGENPLECLGFLHFVAAYGLRSEFNMDELIDCILIIGKYRQTMDLCRKLGLGDKVADLIHKLLSQGKQLLAVKFVFEFQLTDKFPPVPLLKEYLKESKNLAKKVCREGKNSLKSLNEATAKEVGAMRSVIKVIEDYKLESEYPRGILEKQIEQLEKQKASRKRPAAKQQQVKNQKQQQQNGSKRPRTEASVGLVVAPKSYGAANSTVSSYQHSHLQSTGLLPDGPAPHVSSSAAPYGMPGLTPPIAPYVGSSARLYGLAGAPMGFSGNPTAGGSLLYSSEPYVESGYYDRPTAYTGYSVPSQYHPAYYPQ
ncbi:FRIGIDA-like protein 1 [Ziziphus jujuba]|uniref:FRIGIDA-like protein n=1 Tax=Ziziphus jujuba TaxID=326968 RepID=A0ABM3I5V1_ZIZJJ|nr:FRIGIDA-like protein 1 [Ziziphus jujuba]